MPMTPGEMGEKLKAAIALLEEVGDEMNTSARACQCCGLSVRESMDDYQGKLAIDGAVGRVTKLYERLYNGEWQGREMAPVVTAQSLRGGK